MFLLVEALLRRPRGISVENLCERLDGCSPKTIQRYVKCLNEVAAWSSLLDEVTIEGRRGERRVVLKSNEDKLDAQTFQYVALYAIARQIASLKETHLNNNAEHLLSRLEQEVADGLPQRVAKAFHYQAFGPKNYASQDEVMDDVLAAIVYNQTLRLQYLKHDSRGPDEYMFEPWTLVMYRDGLYIHGLRRRDGQKRTLAIERIQSVQRLRDERFERPADFNPKTHFGRLFGLFDSDEDSVEIVLAFDPTAAEWARERNWPGEVQWDEHEDGRPLLRLRQIPHREVVNWLIGWTHKVEVIAPTSLRQRVIDIFRKTLAQYEAPKEEA